MNFMSDPRPVGASRTAKFINRGRYRATSAFIGEARKNLRAAFPNRPPWRRVGVSYGFGGAERDRSRFRLRLVKL